MRFLIVGASGFIGRHLWKWLTQQQVALLGTQAHALQPEFLRFDLAHDRILDQVPATFLEAPGTCYVVYASVFGSPDQCARQMELSRLVNVDAVRHVVQDLSPFSVRHVYLSSSYVFDGLSGRYQESDPCRPICEYGRQKVDMERYLLDNVPQSLILRLDKVVGDDPDEQHLLAEWNQQLKQRQPIRCIREQTLSPVLVDDVARLIWEACRRNLSGVFHVSGVERVERVILARQFQLATAAPGTIAEADSESFPFADPRPLHSDLDGRALRGSLGFQPASVQQILKRFADRAGIRKT